MNVQGKIIIFLLMIIAMGCHKIDGRDPILHRVGGGRYTWAPNVNFTKWASHEHFYKGDWLCKCRQLINFQRLIISYIGILCISNVLY